MNRFYDIPFVPCRELAPWEWRARNFQGTDGVFELAERIKMRSDIAGGVIILEAKMLSDLASIPTVLMFLTMTTDDQRIGIPSWFHDHLYKSGGYIQVYNEDETPKAMVQLTRQQCDQILCDEGMVDCYASVLDRWKVYRGLRMGGMFNFRQPVKP